MILASEQRRPEERPGPPKLREVYCGCENDSRAHTAHGITGPKRYRSMVLSCPWPRAIVSLSVIGLFPISQTVGWRNRHVTLGHGRDSLMSEGLAEGRG